MGEAVFISYVRPFQTTLPKVLPHFNSFPPDLFLDFIQCISPLSAFRLFVFTPFPSASKLVLPAEQKLLFALTAAFPASSAGPAHSRSSVGTQRVGRKVSELGKDAERADKPRIFGRGAVMEKRLLWRK